MFNEFKEREDVDPFFFDPEEEKAYEEYLENMNNYRQALVDQHREYCKFNKDAIDELL